MQAAISEFDSPEIARIRLTLIGRAARHALLPGVGGTVLAVFKRSFYLQTERGCLVCVGNATIGAGPLHAVYDAPRDFDWRASGLRAAERWFLDDGVLSVGGRYVFLFAGAENWRSSSPGPNRLKRDLGAGLSRLEDACRARLPSEGLAWLIPELVRVHLRSTTCGGHASLCPPYGFGDSSIRCRLGKAKRAQQATVDSLFPTVAAQGIFALGAWLEEALSEGSGPQAMPSSDANVMIGLGPGLTPSGDDFLGGVLIALNAFGRPEVARTLGAWLLPRAKHATGKISVAHLGCAAEGEGAGALHDLIAALTNSDVADLHANLNAIDAIGHTSGWDALAGIVLVGSVLTARR